MENETDTVESLNPQGEVAPETTEDVSQETSATYEDFLKAQELAKNQKIRAEKAEKELKALKGQLTEKLETPKNDFSIKDFKALSDVHDDDVDEVVDYAKFKGISIAEAKKNPIIRNLLKEKEEMRQTAQATNTGSAKRGTSKLSDDTLLEQLETGDLKEENIEKAAKARLERMKKGS